MKTFRVTYNYQGYDIYTVAAENEDEALALTEEMWDLEVKDPEVVDVDIKEVKSVAKFASGLQLEDE